MNQRRQQGGGNRGGGGRQGNQVQQQDDKPINRPAGVVFAEIMRGVDQMAPTIQASLPTDVSFGLFRATLMMAMRHNPDIMNCSAGSIITGAMKAAIDGVVLDGKEAALIPSSNKVKDFETGREFWRKDARYNIMVAGIRKSIMKGGKIRDLQSTVVYANEKFSYKRGLNPELDHTPILDEEKRGLPVGAYSVAWFADGGHPSFEVMNKTEIETVRDSAQSGAVWKGPMKLEMWRKTVVRRHRKALPGQETRVDAEAREDFGFSAQFDVSAGNDGVLPSKTQAADAPRRADFEQLEHTGGEAGTPLDFGSSGEMSAEEVEREQRGDEPVEQQRKTMTAKASEQQQAEPAAEEEQQPREPGPVPEGFETWEAWAAALTTKMKTAATLTKLDAVTAEHREQFDQAPDEIRQQLNDLYEEKATDHREAVK